MSDIVLGHITAPIPENTYCGTRDLEIGFTAPIALLEGDTVAIDSRDGQPLVIYRNRMAVWKFEGYYISGSFTGTFTADLEGLEALWKAFKVRA